MSCSGELLQFPRRERRFDFQEIRAARHAFQMLRQAERPAVHDAHGLEKPVAVHETTVVDRNDRLRFGHKLAVEKDDHAFLMRLPLSETGSFREWKNTPFTISD